jgi:hypothetical protein
MSEGTALLACRTRGIKTKKASSPTAEADRRVRMRVMMDVLNLNIQEAYYIKTKVW